MRPSWPLLPSTAYGRVEMTTLGPGDRALDRRLLYVKTATHWRERWHLIPKAIIPYLKAGIGRPISPRQAKSIL